MAESRNPELQRLLEGLSGYAPRTPPPPQAYEGNGESHTAASLHNTPATLPQLSSIPGLGFLRPEQADAPFTNLRPISRLKSPQPPRSPPTTTASPNSAPKLPIPDASTITTWPAALKHVTKHLAPSDAFSARIRHLIDTQHKHEQQWHDGRLALVKMQSSRTSTSAQVASLLSSIGGKAVSAKPADVSANEKELQAYDEKVYVGLIAMSSDFDRQLRGLGVPFYAIKHDLVILEDGTEKQGAVKGRLDKGELRELQRRMLQLLEDLFGE